MTRYMIDGIGLRPLQSAVEAYEEAKTDEQRAKAAIAIITAVTGPRMVLDMYNALARSTYDKNFVNPIPPEEGISELTADLMRENDRLKSTINFIRTIIR